MTYDDFHDFIKGVERPVVLLEGTRELPEEDRPKLVALGEKLARECPGAIFRTGNAPGSDEAFAEGVAKVDPSRLEYVLPYPKHRSYKISAKSRKVALTELNPVTAERAVRETAKSSPKYISLLERRATVPQLASKSRYLLRDTVKVIGAIDSGLAPANAAIFYVRADDPMKGGTGHTIRVCRQRAVPVVCQDAWMAWPRRP